MKILKLLALVSLIISPCYAQNNGVSNLASPDNLCKKYYQELKSLNYNYETINIDIEKAQKLVNGIDKDKCKISESKWLLILRSWDSFLAEKKYRLIEPVNHSDKKKVQAAWNNFQSLLHDYEDQIFIYSDNTLIGLITNLGLRIDTLKRDVALEATVNPIKKLPHQINHLKHTARTIENIILETVIPSQLDIQTHLYRRDISLKDAIGISGFDNSTYGLNYLHVFTPKKKDALNATVALIELTAPIRDAELSNLGIFLSAGIHHKSLALLAGLGYLNTVAGIDKISWKATAMYFPWDSKIGFGAAYSPLTKTGIMVSFKLN